MTTSKNLIASRVGSEPRLIPAEDRRRFERLGFAVRDVPEHLASYPNVSSETFVSALELARATPDEASTQRQDGHAAKPSERAPATVISPVAGVRASERTVIDGRANAKRNRGDS